jgi:hypothetical protein
MIKQIESLVSSVLFDIDMASSDAIALLMGTAAAESGFRHLRQIGGIARSWWQVEPETASDNLWSYLRFRPQIWQKVVHTCVIPSDIKNDYTLDLITRLLEVNIAFAICMARIKYWRVPEPLPHYADIESQSKYWLEHYNAGGKGTIEHYIKSNQILTERK